MALLFVLAAPVLAVNMSISHLGYGPDQDVQLFAPNGTMFGSYNTSSINIPVPNADYYVVIKPQTSNPLADPTDWLVNQVFPFFQSNVIGIVLCFTFIGLLLARVK